MVIEDIFSGPSENSGNCEATVKDSGRANRAGRFLFSPTPRLLAASSENDQRFVIHLTSKLGEWNNPVQT